MNFTAPAFGAPNKKGAAVGFSARIAANAFSDLSLPIEAILAVHPRRVYSSPISGRANRRRYRPYRPVLALEPLWMPDDQAIEVLRLVDGAREVDAIIDAGTRRCAKSSPATSSPCSRA
jgi:hypothetical protein